MQRILFTLIMAVASLLAQAYTVDQIPNVHVENRTRYVSNPDGILSPQAQTQADSILSNIWRTSSAEAVAVVVNNIDGSDIDSFATDLFTKWGIGKSDNDNGLLVLIVKDMRKAAIRTGYGIEGVIPDVIAGRIIRENMAPHFKQGDYDAGTIEALSRLEQIITDPTAAAELMSENKSDAQTSTNDYFTSYLMIAGFFTTLLLLGMWITAISKSRNKSRHEKYMALNKFNLAALICVFIGLGLPLIVYIPMLLNKRYLRTASRKCPNCASKMKRLSEDEDNRYLTAAQDYEERIDSVDYDVWLCDKCGETDILPYVKESSTYTECPVCGARACSLVSNRIITHATVKREGCGVKEYRCGNCQKLTQKTYTIPKEVPVVVVGGGGSGFGGGGGGFSGGSFGGGVTGGGGASGGW